MVFLNRLVLTMDLSSPHFHSILMVNNVKHTFSAACHPATIAKAERFDQTFKINMKCRQTTSSTIKKCTNKFLHACRTTSHAAARCLPSLLMRRIWRRLDFMKSDFGKEKQQG